MKLFDEWAGGDEESGAQPNQAVSGGAITVEYSYTRVTGKSVSITGNEDDVDRLSREA